MEACFANALLRYAFLRNFKCVCTLNFKIHISGNDPRIIAQVYTCFRVLDVMHVCVLQYGVMCVCACTSADAYICVNCKY